MLTPELTNLNSLTKNLPDHLTSRELYKILDIEGVLGQILGTAESLLLDQICQILTSAEFVQAINQGKITLAMIKPDLLDGININALHGSEDDLQDQLLSQIKPPLTILLQIVLQMDQETIETWYQGNPRINQEKIPPIKDQRYGLEFENRWQELVALLKHGPATFVVLYSEIGTAVQEWREQMGNHWNLTKVRNELPSSLRARFAIDNHNNLVHGSDSVESVQTEINLLVQLIKKYQLKIKQS